MVGNILIIFTIVYVIIFAGGRLSEQTEPAPGLMFANPTGWINTLGFTVFSYEGIGLVMPIMAITEKPERFKEMLLYAMITLMIVYISFDEICYFAWGTDMNEPIIT